MHASATSIDAEAERCASDAASRRACHSMHHVSTSMCVLTVQ